jgi:two-component system, cell cycle sensor histidine kinase and response regulator CckA
LTIETRTMVTENPVADSTPEMEPGRYVMLSVGDTGEGMDGDTLSKIFDPFFTTKGENAGTGLGLSTVYGIVKQHGGHITVDSELGSGTIFRIYLPLIEDAVAPGLDPCTRLGSPEGAETILLVEDEEAVRNLTGEALEIFGYKVLKAASPGEAIALSRDHSDYIHLLLTDVILPQMDGKSLFDVIRRERPDIKALFMSGYTENFIVHHGVLDPEVNFIPKPFVIEGLGHKVREILDPDKKPSET